MGIRPINDDHAIEQVSFSLSFDKNVGALIGEQMSPYAKILMEDLPAIAPPRSYNRELQPEPHTPPYPGVEFSRFRPNGTAAWAVRIVGFELSIECTRYTRWKNVWGQAHSYLKTAIDALNTAGEEVFVKAIMMSVRDAFVASEGTPASSALAQPEVLALPALNSGAFWHVNQGWLAPRPTGSLLNRLNLSSIGHADTQGFAVPDTYRLVVDHLAKMTFTEPHELRSVLGTTGEIVEEMHIENKANLTRLIKQDLLERIGLLRETVRHDS